MAIKAASKEHHLAFSLVPFFLLIIPMLEIGAFIAIGGQIGIFPTLTLIVVTAIVGSILLRIQGFGLLAKIQNDMNEGRVPARELIHGVMIMIAGILLLTPGFVTDTFGFLLFFPPFRDFAWSLLKNRITIAGVSGTGFQNRKKSTSRSEDNSTIDLGEDEYHQEPDPDSPWSSDGKSGR